MSINKLKKLLENTNEVLDIRSDVVDDIHILQKLKEKYSIADIPLERRAELIRSFNNTIEIIRSHIGI